MKKVSPILVLILLTIVPTFMLWFPFLLKVPSVWGIPMPRDGMASVVANYDGPLYMVVAKTLYNAPEIESLYSFPLPVQYYAAHFPLFPVLIHIVSPLLGMPYGMLFITLLSSFAAIYFFYLLALHFEKSKPRALWLTAVFALFPARWLAVRSVGSADPLFVAAIIASVYFFNKKNFLLSGIAGLVATLTKSPGILLFVAYFISLLFDGFNEITIRGIKNKAVNTFSDIKSVLRVSPIILIPLGLLSVFVLYKFTFGDFLAYFHSGDNIHLMFPPFSVFNSNQPWVGTYWLEDVLFLYLFMFLALANWIKEKNWNIAIFVGVFTLAIISVAHRDVIRYALPVIPFVILSFRNFLIRNEVKFALLFMIIPIYIYTLSFITGNVMPISDWTPFL